MSLEEDVSRLEKIATRQEGTLRKLIPIEGWFKGQEKRIASLERIFSELTRDVRAQGTYGKRIAELEKTLENLAKALADLEKDIARKDADNQAQKDIKKTLKKVEDAQKDAMTQVRKMNVDARLANLEKLVQVAMGLASARR